MISNHRQFDRTLLCLLFVFEALLFWTVYNREVAWYPPGNFDQAGYLVSAYRLQEDVLAHGIPKLWKAVWRPGYATGIALPIEGALAGLIIGGARFPQLCVNLAFFFALQGVAFSTARFVWGRRLEGYLMVGLILCQTTPWIEAGGLFDFRIDFLAYCLYGVWACAVLRSNLFLDRRWAIACGLIGAFLVFHRFFTAIYLLGVCAGFAGVSIILGLVARKNEDLVSRTKQRLMNLCLSLGCLLVVIVPILLNNWKVIRDYYFIGHVVSEEKYIRASEVGIHDFVGHLLFYPRSIALNHWGQMFLWASVIVIATGLIARLLVRAKGSNDQRFWYEEAFWLQLIFLLGAVLGPIVVLTVDVSKSPVVGGIVGVPAALLVTVIANVTWPKQNEFSPWLIPKLFAGSAILIFSLGVFNQLNRASRHWPEFDDRVYLTEVADFSEWLLNYAREYHWKNPTISLDLISGRLNYATITAMGFEKTGQFVDFRGLLSTSIFGIPREQALKLLEQSDFVILTSPPQPGNYPFTQAIAAYWPELKAWAEQHLVIARTQHFDSVFPYTATVYVRPSARLRDVSGDWITSKGVLIEAKRDVLDRFRLIQLRGLADFAALPKIPAVMAKLETEHGSQPVPAVFRRIGNEYEIDLDTAGLELPQTDEVKVRVSFDTFFVRKDAAAHNDYRELVVRKPDVRLLTAE
jgi:hypothetical protein